MEDWPRAGCLVFVAGFTFLLTFVAFLVVINALIAAFGH